MRRASTWVTAVATSLALLWLALGNSAAANASGTPACAISYLGQFGDYFSPTGFGQDEAPFNWRIPDGADDRVVSLIVTGLPSGSHRLTGLSLQGWKLLGTTETLIGEWDTDPTTYFFAAAVLRDVNSGDYLNNADSSIDITFSGTAGLFYVREATDAPWQIEDWLVLNATLDGEPMTCRTTITELPTTPPTVLPTIPADPTTRPRVQLSVNDHTVSTTAGQPLAGDVRVGNQIPAGSSFMVTTPPAHGLLDWSDDGTYTYRPAARFVGSDSFTYAVCAPNGRCQSASERISVLAAPAPRGVAAHTGDTEGPSGLVGWGLLGLLASVLYAVGGFRSTTMANIRLGLISALGLALITVVVASLDLARRWLPTRPD